MISSSSRTVPAVIVRQALPTSVRQIQYLLHCNLVFNFPGRRRGRARRLDHLHLQTGTMSFSISLSGTKATPIPIKDVELPISIFNKSLFTSILDHWYSGITNLNQTQPIPEIGARWFGVGPLATPERTKALDEECRRIGESALSFLSPDKVSLPRFSSVPSEAVKEELEAVGDLVRPFASLPVFSSSSEATRDEKADAVLALVLLIDQFTRNTLRANQKLIYAHYDVIARSIVHAVALPPPAGAEHTAGKLYNLHLGSVLAAARLKYTFLLMPLMHSEAIQDHDTFNDLNTLGKAQDQKELSAEDDFEKRHRVILERFGRYPHRNSHLERSSTEEEKRYLNEGGESFGT